MVCPLGPPVYADSSTATWAHSPGRPQGSAAPGAPWAPPNCHLQAPWVVGPAQSSNTCALSSQGVRITPSVQGRAAPVPIAIVGRPAAWRSTWRRRVQAGNSPARLSVRPPQPRRRGLGHQATHYPPHTGTAASPSRVCYRGVRGQSTLW